MDFSIDFSFLAAFEWAPHEHEIGIDEMRVSNVKITSAASVFKQSAVLLTYTSHQCWTRAGPPSAVRFRIWMQNFLAKNEIRDRKWWKLVNYEIATWRMEYWKDNSKTFKQPKTPSPPEKTHCESELHWFCWFIPSAFYSYIDDIHIFSLPMNLPQYFIGVCVAVKKRSVHWFFVSFYSHGKSTHCNNIFTPRPTKIVFFSTQRICYGLAIS